MHNNFARLHLPTNPMFRSTLRRALLPLLTLNTVIAVGITVFGEHTLGANLLYSQCIGLCTAGLIDLGRYLLIRDWSKHMPRLVAVVPLSVVLDHLIAYLRATLSASQSTHHTLAQEFDRLRDYLELMAVRMGTRLRFALDLPAELANLPVPTLLLQPLVENSIKHGLEPKVEGGSVTVRARRADHTLVLEVTDTGLGPGNSAALLPSALHSGGFGLAQVRERLDTVFGTDATINLIASSAGGTSVAITIPLQP